MSFNGEKQPYPDYKYMELLQHNLTHTHTHTHLCRVNHELSTFIPAERYKGFQQNIRFKSRSFSY